MPDAILIRHCFRCKDPLPETRKDSYCKPCRNHKSKEWSAANPKKRSQMAKNWRDKNYDSRRHWERHYEETHRKEKYATHKRWRAGESGKTWIERNRAKDSATAGRWIKTHRPSVNARRKRHWAANRGRLREYARLKRERNPERIRLLDRQRYVRHREKRILLSIAVRAKRLQAEGNATPEQCRELLEQFKSCCGYCHTPLTYKNKTYDHKTPLSRGGTNYIENLIPSCRPCNARKHTRTYEEFVKLIQP